MSFSLIILRVFMLMAMMLAGYICAKAGVFKEGAAPVISALIMNLSLPCNIFIIMLRPVEEGLLSLAWTVAAIAFVLYLISMPLSKLYCRLAGIEGGQIPPQRCAVVFSNVSFMGLPIAAAFFNPRILFLAAIWNIVFFTFYVAVAPAVFIPDYKFRFRDLAKSPAVMSSVAGLAGFALSLRLPAAVSESLTLIGNMTTPLSMIFIGITLSGVDFRDLFGDSRLWLTTFVRLALLPFLAFFLVRPLTQSPEPAVVTALLLGLPVAALTSIFAEKYGADVKSASRLVFLSTVVSMITLPVLVYLLLAVCQA